MITTAFELEIHLANFIKKYYNQYLLDDGTLRLPTSSSLYFLVYEEMKRRPAHVSGVDRGNLRIALPYPRGGGKKPESYNWLSPVGVKRFARRVDLLLTEGLAVSVYAGGEDSAW